MQETGKPILAVSMSEHKKRGGAVASQGLFTTPTPERAIATAATLARYVGWRNS